MASGSRRCGAVAAAALSIVAMAASACTVSPSEKSVTFAGTGGNLGEVQREGAFVPLQEQEGIRVREDSPNNEAKLKTMVKAGKPTWDVYYSSPYRAKEMCGTMFEKIDRDKVDVSNVDPKPISDCGVPFMRSAFILVYDKDTYGENGPKSWQDFFDTEKFPGERGIMNYAKDAALEVALLADGVPGEDLYPLDYDRAFDKLDTIRKDITFFKTGAQQSQALESGRVDMMLAWPGRAYEAKKNGANLEVVWNQPLLYYDVLTIVKGTEHKEEATKLINQMIGVEAQEYLSEHLPYPGVNQEADPKPDELLREFMVTYHEGSNEVVRDNAWWADNLEKATEEWTQWVNA